MKTLKVSEALIALMNSEKITSDWFAHTNDNKYVQLIDSKICYKDGKESSSVLAILQENNLRIYKEFTYPMWFKNICSGEVFKFNSLKSGVYPDGSTSDTLYAHTQKEIWQQVEEPKKMIKVAQYRVFKKKWYGASEYFKNERDCLKSHSFATKAKRLDYTEIEIEEEDYQDA